MNSVPFSLFVRRKKSTKQSRKLIAGIEEGSPAIWNILRILKFRKRFLLKTCLKRDKNEDKTNFQFLPKFQAQFQHSWSIIQATFCIEIDFDILVILTDWVRFRVLKIFPFRTSTSKPVNLLPNLKSRSKSWIYLLPFLFLKLHAKSFISNFFWIWLPIWHRFE